MTEFRGRLSGEGIDPDSAPEVLFEIEGAALRVQGVSANCASDDRELALYGYPGFVPIGTAVRIFIGSEGRRA